MLLQDMDLKRKSVVGAYSEIIIFKLIINFVSRHWYMLHRYFLFEEFADVAGSIPRDVYRGEETTQYGSLSGCLHPEALRHLAH